MEGGGGQWQRQWPILRLAAGGSVNESRAGHVWVGRRDSPAAETDATVVRLNFFCQAPPSTGQKQTQMLVASVCVSVCASIERKFDSVSGSTRSTHKRSSNRLLFNPVHLQSPPLFSESLSHSYLYFSPSIFLTLSSQSFSLHLYSIFSSAAKLAPTAVKREEAVREWGGAGWCGGHSETEREK